MAIIFERLLSVLDIVKYCPTQKPKHFGNYRQLSSSFEKISGESQVVSKETAMYTEFKLSMSNANMKNK